jgi:hypothetical protein
MHKQQDTEFVPLDRATAKLLLELWMVRAHRAASAHYLQASHHKLKDMRLTVINASAAVLVLYFANATWIENFVNGGTGSDTVGSSSKYTIVAGLLSLVVVITTILQFMKRWGERSDIHKMAGAEFSNFQRKTERYLLEREINMSMVHNLNRDYNHATKIYPLVNKKIWEETANGELGARIKNLQRCLRNADPNFVFDEK